MGLISGTVYYASLAYSAAALALFLFRTLHLRVEPEVDISFFLLLRDIYKNCKIQHDYKGLNILELFQVHGVENHGKRKLWLLFVLAGGKYLNCFLLLTFVRFRLAAHRDVVADILSSAGQVTSHQ